MKARISQLHMTESEWLKYPSLIPEPGEIIVYDPDDKYSYARLKIGDGVHTLNQLDFLINSAILEALNKISFEDTIDGGRITEHSK